MTSASGDIWTMWTSIFDAAEVAEVAGDHVPLHGEQADFGFQREARPTASPPAIFWIVPDDFIEREGDLLLGLELDDLGDLLLFDRRQFDEPRQTGLPGDADGDLVVLDLVAGEELLERLADQRVRVGVRLGEDLRCARRSRTRWRSACRRSFRAAGP